MSAHDDGALSYIECDLPPGLTIAEYRRARAAHARAAKKHRRSLRRHIGGLLRRAALLFRPKGSARERMP